MQLLLFEATSGVLECSHRALSIGVGVGVGVGVGLEA